MTRVMSSRSTGCSHGWPALAASAGLPRGDGMQMKVTRVIMLDFCWRVCGTPSSVGAEKRVCKGQVTCGS